MQSMIVIFLLLFRKAWNVSGNCHKEQLKRARAPHAEFYKIHHKMAGDQDRGFVANVVQV